MSWCVRDKPQLNAVYRARTDASNSSRLVESVLSKHRTVTSLWHETPSCRSVSIERALADASYRQIGDYHGCVAMTHDWHRGSRPNFRVERVRDMASLRDFFHVLQNAFQVQLDHSADDLKFLLNQCADSNSRIIRFVCYDGVGGPPIAVGGTHIVPYLHFALLWGGATLPPHRGCGAYSALFAARMAHLKSARVQYAGLFAKEDTASPVVLKQGFQRFGTMTLWERPRDSRC